jgi:hypothetical protein
VYKARDLDEQGCELGDIGRMGGWLKDALTVSYLKYFTPQGLLAAGGWDKDRRDSFFAERFFIPVPEGLKAEVFPFLATLREQVQAMGKDAPKSARATPEVLDYLAAVLVQDACDLLVHADIAVRAAAAANPVIKRLKRLPQFWCGLCMLCCECMCCNVSKPQTT